MHHIWSVSMGENDRPAFVRRLEQLRDANQWSIAEMARRADLPKRSMENYFKGHKPGLDALVSMARGFGVPVDFLVGHALQSDAQIEKIVYEAALPTILSVVRRIGLHVSEGREVFREGTVFSVPLDRYADEEAREVVRRFTSIFRHLSSADESCAKMTEE
jgi:transcriptional regulator with XRE-family HTH domain